jgi:hypothetical protein
MAGFSVLDLGDVLTYGVPAAPSANNLKAWTFDPVFADSANTLPTSTAVFSAFTPTYTQAYTTSNKFWVYVGSAPTARTYGAIGIYNAAGSLLAISSSTDVFSTTGAISVTFNAGVTLAGGTTYYLAVLSVHTVGSLTLWGTSTADPAGLDNINIAAPAAGTLGYRIQSIGSMNTLTNTLPATVPTIQSSYTWFGIS